MATVTRTAAAVRYVGAEAVRSQRVLLPIVAFAAVVAVLFGGDPGPLPLPWAASAFALYPVAAWVALVVANALSAQARSVAVVATGGLARVVAATTVVALAFDALLVALAVVVPALVTHYPVTAATIGTGIGVHVAAATTGTAVGLLTARPLVARVGWSFLIALVVVTVTAVQPWLPPVGSAIRILTSDGPGMWANDVLGLVLACAAGVVVWAVERGR